MYRAHCAVIFAIAQLSCKSYWSLVRKGTGLKGRELVRQITNPSHNPNPSRAKLLRPSGGIVGPVTLRVSDLSPFQVGGTFSVL